MQLWHIVTTNAVVNYCVLKPHSCIMNKTQEFNHWCCFAVSTGRHKNIHAVAIVEEDVQGERPPRCDLRLFGNVTCQLPCLGHLDPFCDPEKSPE